MKKKETIELTVIAILVLILIFLSLKAMKKGEKVAMAPSVKIQPLEQKVTVPVALPAVKEKTDLATISPSSDVPSAPEKDTLEKSLTGILWSKNNPEAIIKHTVVRIGDTVDGKKIVDIQKDKVILNDGTKDLELEF